MLVNKFNPLIYSAIRLRRKVVNKGALLVLILLTLTACASQYTPLTNTSKYASGYQEQLLNAQSRNENLPNQARYLLTYQGTTSDTKELITGYWQKRAKELCPKGYKVESHHQTIVYDTIRSPVNGMMVNLGTVQPIDKGIIQCLN